MMLGEGAKAGLQRTSSLEDMLYYVTPRTMASLLKHTNNNPEKYEAIDVKGEPQEQEDYALERMLTRAKELGCVAITEPRLELRDAKFLYSGVGVKYKG